MNGYDSQCVIFALMIGIHDITACFGQMLCTVYVSMNKAVPLHHGNGFFRHMITVRFGIILCVMLNIAHFQHVENNNGQGYNNYKTKSWHRITLISNIEEYNIFTEVIQIFHQFFSSNFNGILVVVSWIRRKNNCSKKC